MSIKVCVIFYKKFVIEAVEKKQAFLQSFNIPKCIVVGLSVVVGLFSLLFYCESGINQYTVQKTLTDVFGSNLLLIQLGCHRYVVLQYHFRILRVFMRIIKVLFWGLSVKYIFLVITYFCSSYITEKKINDLENLLFLCYLEVLFREVTIHIQNRLWNLVFQKSERDLCYVGLIRKKIL